MIRVLLITLMLFALLRCRRDEHEKVSGVSGKVALTTEPAILRVEASVFSFLILDSIPMGKISDRNEYRLLPGTHTLQIHNIGCKHFDTTLTLGPGPFLFKKFFSEREVLGSTSHGPKRAK